MAQAADGEILDLARREACVLVTLDADFHALLTVSGATGPTVIRIRIEGLKGPEMAALIQRVLQRIDDPPERCVVATVNARNIRLKRLPIID